MGATVLIELFPLQIQYLAPCLCGLITDEWDYRDGWHGEKEPRLPRLRMGWAEDGHNGAALHAHIPYRPWYTENDYLPSGGSAFHLSELLNGKHHAVISFDLIECTKIVRLRKGRRGGGGKGEVNWTVSSETWSQTTILLNGFPTSLNIWFNKLFLWATNSIQIYQGY